MRPLLAFSAVCLALSAAPLALAATDPPAGYEETCTAAQRAEAGTKCDTCAGSADMPAACQTKFSMTDNEYVCQTWGDTKWTELWCNGPTKDVGIHPGCALGAGSDGAAGVVVLAAAAALLRRRRSAAQR
jgi:hypothetical protein